MNIAIIGPSGAGKGSHAGALGARYGLLHVSTGDLFRRHLETRTALGLLARRSMEQGDLVPDEIVDAMIEEWADKLPVAKGALFDGFPRTTDQVKFFEELFAGTGRVLDAVIYLQVSDEEIVRRLSGRLICRDCQTPSHAVFQPTRQPFVCDRCGGMLYQRSDDTAALVHARLRVFHRTTGPVLEHYATAKKLLIVSGEGKGPEVEARLVGMLDALKKNTARFASRDEIKKIFSTTTAATQAVRATRDIILLGGPGSGKGTQAERLCAELGLLHVATGDLFRENLQRATELGRLAKTYMDRGELVPDDVTDAMVEERLSLPDAREGFVLDGFPRTIHQTEALQEILTRLQRRLSGVLYINVSDDAIIDRLSGRMICRSCQAPYHRLFKPAKKSGVCDACSGELYQRADDNPETVCARLVTFHRQTEPLIEYYRRAGLLLEIDGEGDVAGTSARSLAAVRAFTNRTPPTAPTISQQNVHHV